MKCFGLLDVSLLDDVRVVATSLLKEPAGDGTVHSFTIFLFSLPVVFDVFCLFFFRNPAVLGLWEILTREKVPPHIAQ